MSSSDNTQSLFIANYIIGGGIPGGISCTLHLWFNPTNAKVGGHSTVFQAINPPLLVESIVDGYYQPIYTMTTSDTLVVLEGFSGGHGSLKNFSLRMALDETLESGTANYSFLDGGEWKTVKGQKVELIKQDNYLDVSEFAKSLANKKVA